MDPLVVVAALAAAGAVAALWGPDARARLRADPGDRAARAPAGRLRWRRPARDAGAPAGRADDVARVCLLLAVCLDAGRPPRSALRVVADVVDGPARETLVAVLRQIDLGLDEAVAWGSLAETPGYGPMARDLARAVHSGVALAELLRRHGEDARRQALLTAQVRARAAGVTGVLPVVVCFLPAFLLLGVVPVFGGLLGRFFG